MALHSSQRLTTCGDRIEASTPVIGWAAGLAAAAFILAIDHWIAFGLLGAIGGKILWESLRHDEGETKATRHSFAALFVTAIGTSIDAVVVGIG
jgi:manganese efflux pump family protein